MPAYYVSKWYSIIFVLFIVIAMYIFLAIILAVVYENYRKFLLVSASLCHTGKCPAVDGCGLQWPVATRGWNDKCHCDQKRSPCHEHRQIEVQSTVKHRLINTRRIFHIIQSDDVVHRREVGASDLCCERAVIAQTVSLVAHEGFSFGAVHARFTQLRSNNVRAENQFAVRCPG